ncbi:MAG: hypothetical protein P4K80_08070 [Acidobacteriaceae bacterium]|nr:hypothetical protein [Acidobacteriaceae bacterium]
MSANSAQRLARHVASSAGSAQLNTSDVILKTKQLQIPSIALHGRPDALNRIIDYD